MEQDKPLTNDQIGVLEKVQKLLMLADKNPSSAEAASAAAKAQELLLAHNLDADLVGQVGDVAAGRREEQKVRGGFYEYQASIWGAVAELNFCLYWTSGSYVEKHVRYKHWSGEMRTDVRHVWQKHHRLIGRRHNVAATRAMSTYLEQSVERLVMERLGGQNNQRFSRWAVSFREGAVYDITRRIYQRRKEMLAEETRRAQAAREAEVRAATAGASTETAVTIASLTASELDANVDFMMGEEGYSAKKRAQRAAKAAAAREAEAEHARWAAAHPEEARAQEAERRKEAEKAERRRSRARGSSSNGKEVDISAWSSGEAAAEKIGLDLQAGGTRTSGALGNG